MPVFWWVGLNLVFLVGSTTSGGVFLGVCELSMILGSHSANGWGCVPVLLVDWHGASSTGACWPLSWSWVSALRWRSLGELSPIDITWDVGPGGLWWSNVLNLALPPWRLRPDTWLEYQDLVSHTAQKKRGKKRKKTKLKENY